MTTKLEFVPVKIPTDGRFIVHCSQHTYEYSSVSGISNTKKQDRELIGYIGESCYTYYVDSSKKIQIENVVYCDIVSIYRDDTVIIPDLHDMCMTCVVDNALIVITSNNVIRYDPIADKTSKISINVEGGSFVCDKYIISMRGEESFTCDVYDKNLNFVTSGLNIISYKHPLHFSEHDDKYNMYDNNVLKWGVENRGVLDRDDTYIIDSKTVISSDTRNNTIILINPTGIVDLNKCTNYSAFINVGDHIITSGDDTLIDTKTRIPNFHTNGIIDNLLYGPHGIYDIVTNVLYSDKLSINYIKRIQYNSDDVDILVKHIDLPMLNVNLIKLIVSYM